MIRTLAVFMVFVLTGLCLHSAAQNPTASAPQHGPNFEDERKRADELFQAQKPLEALPLYEDLCKQDPTVAVFAERHGAGLLAKQATISDPNERLKVELEAVKEMQRAQRLGDNSAYVRAVLTAESKSFVGAVLSGVPLTVGYTYRGKSEAQAIEQQAEAALGKSDWNGAAQLYVKAATLDPAWYSPALYAGDSFFRLKDFNSAGLWFAKAIAIDPDRETGYRYWGDALFQAGDRDGAREKFVQAVVAEPYGTPAISELQQWTQRTGHQLVKPAITRPEFVTQNGVLQINPELESSTKDGRSSWIAYQKSRVAHGGFTLNQSIVAGSSDLNAVIHPSGYRHTVAEEHEALRAMLSDIDAKIKAGALNEADLDPSIRDIRNLEKANALGAWIALNAADAGIRSDYPEFRSNHRKHLIDFVNLYMIR
jgi:tetratricopeptide (TPR) repeat protein